MPSTQCVSFTHVIQLFLRQIGQLTRLSDKTADGIEKVPCSKGHRTVAGTAFVMRSPPTVHVLITQDAMCRVKKNVL